MKQPNTVGPRWPDEEESKLSLPRRTFIKNSMYAAVASALPLELLNMSSAHAAVVTSPYGTPVNTPNQDGRNLLKLPPGFRYYSFGWTNEIMDDGLATPKSHDGMGAFGIDHNEDGQADSVILVRNHELASGDASPPGSAYLGPRYDPGAPGGTTTLEFDLINEELVDHRWSLTGTARNCAGGPTPWGSWLTCEESLANIGGAYTKRHGYVFEVPAVGIPTATALTAMGRFNHEAAAVDPETGIVYMTEDETNAGFYRFIPNTPGNLADGGTLQMLKGHQSSFNYTQNHSNGANWAVSWVNIANPNPSTPSGSTSVYSQGRALGGARFLRLEGAWYGDGHIWFASTSGSGSGLGQIFKYNPVTSRLTHVMRSTGGSMLRNPDNLVVSPRGGVLLCEDPDNNTARLHGLKANGDIYPFCVNNMNLSTNAYKGFRADYRKGEFCGACYFDNWLFVNIQTPGVTFAITGPWEKGTL